MAKLKAPNLALEVSTGRGAGSKQSRGALGRGGVGSEERSRQGLMRDKGSREGLSEEEEPRAEKEVGRDN